MSKERIIKALEKEMKEYKTICPKCAEKTDWLSAPMISLVLCEKHQKEKELKSAKKDINLEIAIINAETQLKLIQVDIEMSPENKLYFYFKKQSIIETQLMLLHTLKEKDKNE